MRGHKGTVSGLTYILERIDSLCCFLNFAADDFRDQLRSQLRKTAAGGFTLHDLNHFLPYRPNLR